MKYPAIPTNPLVEKLLVQEVTGVMELEGYPKPHKDGPVCIYRDLSFERYIELPHDAIIHISEPKDPEGPCKVFFKSTASLNYTTKTRVSESTSVTGTLTVLADEVRRTARSRVSPSGSRCSCAAPTDATTALRRADDNAPGGGLEFPPMWCEIGCEQNLNACLDGSFYHPFWCWIDYYSCRIGCIFDSFGGGVVVV
jgi:hypothetical protein